MTPIQQWHTALAQTRAAVAKAKAEVEAATLRVLSAQARLRDLEQSPPPDLAEIPKAWRGETRPLFKIIKGGKDNRRK